MLLKEIRPCKMYGLLSSPLLCMKNTLKDHKIRFNALLSITPTGKSVLCIKLVCFANQDSHNRMPRVQNRISHGFL